VEKMDDYVPEGGGEYLGRVEKNDTERTGDAELSNHAERHSQRN